MKGVNLNFSAKHIWLNQFLMWNLWVTIMLLSWYVNFLQNDMKQSERSVPTVNKFGQYSLGTFGGMFVYLCRAGANIVYCSVLEGTSDTLKKLKNAEESNKTKLSM